MFSQRPVVEQPVRAHIFVIFGKKIGGKRDSLHLLKQVNNCWTFESLDTQTVHFNFFETKDGQLETSCGAIGTSSNLG